MADIAAAIASVRAMEGFAPTSAMSSSIPAPVAVTASASASASATTGTTGTAAVASTNDAAAATSDSSADWLQGALAQLATLERQAATVECPAQCGARVNEIHLADHASVCPAAEVTCPLGCGFRCARRDLFERHLSIGRCTNYTVYCSSFGCTRTLPAHVVERTAEWSRLTDYEFTGCNVVGRADRIALQDQTHHEAARCKVDVAQRNFFLSENDDTEQAAAASSSSSPSTPQTPPANGVRLVSCLTCLVRMCVSSDPTYVSTVPSDPFMPIPLVHDGFRLGNGAYRPSGTATRTKNRWPVPSVVISQEQATKHRRECAARYAKNQASGAAPTAATDESSTSRSCHSADHPQRFSPEYDPHGTGIFKFQPRAPDSVLAAKLTPDSSANPTSAAPASTAIEHTKGVPFHAPAARSYDARSSPSFCPTLRYTFAQSLVQVQLLRLSLEASYASPWSEATLSEETCERLVALFRQGACFADLLGMYMPNIADTHSMRRGMPPLYANQPRSINAIAIDKALAPIICPMLAPFLVPHFIPDLAAIVLGYC